MTLRIKKKYEKFQAGIRACNKIYIENRLLIVKNREITSSANVTYLSGVKFYKKDIWERKYAKKSMVYIKLKI